MKIIKEGNTKSALYRGKCKKCGCIFETNIHGDGISINYNNLTNPPSCSVEGRCPTFACVSSVTLKIVKNKKRK